MSLEGCERRVYVKTPAAHAKLEKAERGFFPVTVFAQAGWGKTSAVEHYYRNKATLRLSCASGALDRMPDPELIRQSVVIIDDVSWLSDRASEEYILSLLRRGDKQIIIIGRSLSPAWLSRAALDLDFVRITERDLILGDSQVEKLLSDAGVELPDEDIRTVTEVSRGYPPVVKLFLRHLSQGEPLGAAMFAEVKAETFRFFDSSFFSLWSEPVRALLLSVCRYPSFSPEFAETLSGRSDVPEVLERCRQIGSFLYTKGAAEYSVSPVLRAFLCWKQDIVWSKERINENYRRAACFFRGKGLMADALFYYDKIGALEEVQRILTENAQRHPGIGQYYELRHYYNSLPRELILQSPVLTAGMSMLCSLTMRKEESESWYRALAELERQSGLSPELRREAKAWLAYLDIGLPHRAGKGLIGIFRRIYTIHQSENISLPELSVTGNSPSLMNGSLDFCDWAKNGEQVARFMQKPVETVLGRPAKGLVNVALAESGFERGTMEPYEVVTRLGNGYADADHNGNIEMCFAAEGVLIRQHLAEGQFPTAVRHYEAFRKKAEAADARQLFPNLDAFGAWLGLYGDDMDGALRYMNSLPDIHTDFYISNRFRHMTQIRCMIAHDRLTEAMDTASYLTRYFEEYQRTYFWIENELLKAIILYRQELPEWQPVLKSALRRAESYHLVRVISMEGAAVLPLLTELQGGVSEKFLSELTEGARRMALRYPNYLKHITKISVELTPREQQILGMLCAGKSTDEICESCCISYSGLKKHNRSIYAKLGAKTRAEAERTAARLGLAHRKGDGK